MSFVIGVVLFALGIGISVALHEAGHMYAAKAFGMKVRRYFIGFGPKIFSFRRGETEYGLKAIPAGGFCDIAGMTALDEVTEEESPRAMWRQKTWKRVTVMAAGILTQFVLGFVILYFMAVSTGLPNIKNEALVGAIAPCAQTAVLSTKPDGKQELRYLPCKPGDPAPAKAAGLQDGDVITSVAGTATPTWPEAVQAIQQHRGPTPVQVQRDGKPTSLSVDVAEVTGIKAQTDPKAKMEAGRVGTIGVQRGVSFHYGALDAFGAASSFTGTMFANSWQGLLRIPDRIPALIHAIGGGERADDTPISVVGASIIGGDAVEAGSWMLFLYLLAALNFIMGVFNILPLLPLDGGHIAVALYERVRDWIRKMRGLAAGGPVDYTKLTGLTMVVIILGGAMMLLTITADIVNPIRVQ